MTESIDRFPDVDEWKAASKWWIKYGRQRVVAMPNYTPPLWWECDIWAVTKAGYTEEIEVKRTHSDFKADAKKRDRYGQSKHGLLQLGMGPNRFSYLLVGEAARLLHDGVLVVPDWAGVLVLEGRGFRDEINLRRPAPLLHKKKRRMPNLEDIYRRAYYRMWSRMVDRNWLAASP